MMNLCVVTGTTVSNQEFRQFVEELGGEWCEDNHDGAAVFSQHKAYVRVDREPLELFRRASTTEELESLQRRIGGQIQGCFSLHYSGRSWGREVGLALAEHTALGMITRWGGTVDRDDLSSDSALLGL